MVNNPLSEHSISALDVPSKKEWFKQQIALYYAKCQELTKKINQSTKEYLGHMWKNNRLCFEIMQLRGKDRAKKQKEWQEDYKKLTSEYCHISSMQVSLFLSQKILSELKAENKKLYHREGAFYE